MPSISVENYLKAIYSLERQGAQRVKTKDLASHLGISLPSVTSMVQSLANDDLVDYQAYRGVRLTESGERAALKVIRNHRLVEAFLVTTLGYTWDEVHDEAERLEHAISDKLADRIDSYLGYPGFDPHGDPIPTAEGNVSRLDSRPLWGVEQGHRVHVVRVLDQHPEVLRFLDSVGIAPGTSLEVTGILSAVGQMSLRLDDGTEVAMAQTLAMRLLVTDLS